MIRSTNLTAVQTTVNRQPLLPTSLAAQIGRLGDSVSLNPQPLPPKALSANIKAHVSALNTQRLASGQAGRFLTASVRSSPTAHVATSLGSQWAADGFLQQKVSLVGRSSIVAALKAVRVVNQLTKAEDLMESAYRRMINPNSTPVDLLRAKEERAQALEIRKSVMPDLSEQQQKALWAISDIQQQGMEDIAWGLFDSRFGGAFQAKGAEEIEKGKQEFQLGVRENQSLTKWILS